MPYEPASYAPTWVEWSLLAAGLAAFALLITVFTKVFPIIAVWEVAEDHEATAAHAGAGEPVGAIPVAGVVVATAGPRLSEEGGR
jgi:molybdopterin-containing oxidoreductase family membrane subunit